MDYRFAKAKPLLWLVKAALAVTLLWVLIHTAQLNLDLLLSVFLHPFYFAAIIAVFYLMVVVNAWRWYRLTYAQSLPFTFRQMLLPTYLGIVFNNVLPGNVGGDFVRLFNLIKKIPSRKSAVIMSVFFDRVLGLMGIFVVVSLVSLARIQAMSHDKTLHYLLLCCMAICMSALLVFLLSLILPSRVGLSGWLSARYHGKKWANAIISLLDAVRAYRHSKAIILEGIVTSVVIQLLMIIAVILLAKTFLFPAISIVDYAIALALTQIVNLIPLAPGGLGIGEMAFANVLMTLNPAMQLPFATIFLAYRLMGFICYLPGVVIYFLTIKPIEQTPSYKQSIG